KYSLLHQTPLHFILELAIHRDIKPANLIRRKKDGKIVLIDFGAVKEVGRAKVDPTHTTTVSLVIGSLGYMPDEQAANKPRYASDIYAVGRVAIQALTGLRPDQFVDDQNTGELVWQNYAQSCQELTSVLDKMVRSHFKERYADASEALVAVRSLSTITEGYLDPTLLPNYLAQTVIGQQEIATTLTGFSPTIQETVGIPISPEILPTVAVNKHGQNQVIAATEIVNSASVSKSLRTQIVPDANSSSKRHSLVWLWGLLGVLSIGFAGFGSYTWLRDRDFQNALDDAKRFQSSANYAACLDKVGSIPSDNSLSEKAKMISQSCKLGQAKEQLTTAQNLAKEGKHQEAIAIASKISTDTPSHAQAKASIADWSDALLVKATDIYAKDGKLNEAVNLANSIPSDTAAGKKARDLVPQWQSAWKNSEANFKLANDASQKRDWAKAIASAKQVADTPFWTGKIQPIRKKAEDELALLSQPAPVNIINPPSGSTDRIVDNPVYNPTPVYDTRPSYSPPPQQEVYTPPAPAPERVYSAPAPSSDCNRKHC
ncbi:hypothetical protein V2H45_15770, partial [Tumidithrix elongata RA019]|nr:hypothetical protein [Tumidithrix elongata RA019]